METRRQRSLDSFVARIWLEYEQNGKPRWRGRIRHVQNGRESYFQDLQEMCNFLEDVSGMSSPRHPN